MTNDLYPGQILRLGDKHVRVLDVGEPNPYTTRFCVRFEEYTPDV
jgi:hypothetical protein